MAAANRTEEELQTLRDWLRFAVSSFSVAKLAYGHGTANALDEAAFLLLHTLGLPIDQFDPFLDARLLPHERRALRSIIERRIVTRKPAAYLTNEAWMLGHSFYVDERVIVPRSHIGELLASRLSGVIADAEAVQSILDLGTGCGCLAILAALNFPRARIDASDVSPHALEVAARNVHDYGLEGRVALITSDLFAALGGKRYELIVANPPYVGAAAMAAFPREYAAEPAIAHAGGVDGMDVVRRILAEAGERLEPEGTLIVEVGGGRDILSAEYPDLPFLWLETSNSAGEVFALSARQLRGETRPGH
jgi:ribosomal protein L3 glutamine methyltransferase